jgi:hypothetical protein
MTATRLPPQEHQGEWSLRWTGCNQGYYISRSVWMLNSKTHREVTGFLARWRIVGSTTFLDQASNLCCVYYHLSISSEESVRVKESVVRCADHGVTISHYLADNGKFKDKAMKESGQSSNFPGVCAHHHYYIHREDDQMPLPLACGLMHWKQHMIQETIHQLTSMRRLIIS